MEQKSDIAQYINDKAKTAHLIGIGGVSMYSLALTLIESGIKITGSDFKESDHIKSLKKHGVPIYIGHSAENIKNSGYIIRSAAIKDDNPEVAAAAEAGIPVFSRAEAWGAIMRRYKHAICVAGTHGKTTTTSMITHCAMAQGVDPTVMIGGDLPLIGGGHRCGKGDTIILEACEYCNSFLKFNPTVAVIVNVDSDHVDFFKDLDEVKKSFRAFALRTPKDGGVVLANSDDPNTMDAIKGIDRRVVTFGLGEDADIRADNITYFHGMAEFDILAHSAKITHLRLLVPGKHNIINALAATAACLAAQISVESVEKGLTSFAGVARRFEFKGQYSGAMVYDDYAHHPSELHALFDAAEGMNFDRIIVAFQPHTYTRTAAFFDDFIRELSRADVLVLADIYAAREKNTLNISSADLAAKIDGAYYIPSFDEITEFLRRIAHPGDIIITVGAGELNLVSEKLTEETTGRKKKPSGFDYGVENGGLRDIADIKMLICYMLKTVNSPLKRSFIDEAIQSGGMASYWNLSQAISELTANKLIESQEIDSDVFYTVTDLGRQCADELEIALPLSVRERAVKQATVLLAKAKALKENKITVDKTDAGYKITCTVMDGELELMSVSLAVADSLQANIIRENFLKDPMSIYKNILDMLA